MTFSKLALIVTLASSALFAGTPVQPASIDTKPEPSFYDSLWDHATLYKNPDSSGIQEISLLGRAHLNWSALDTGQGDWSDWEFRRLRAGLKVKFLDQFDLKAEMRFQPVFGSFYDGLTETTLNWSPDPAFLLSIGKQLPRYTQEGSVSANELFTIERSLLSNTFWVGEDNYSTGVSVSGKAGAWQYYAAALSGEADKEFGKLDAGWYGTVSLGYDFAKLLNVERAVLRADYVYNNGDPDNTTTKPFENTATLGWDVKQGSYGLLGNVITGAGLGKQPDVWGVVLIPTYEVTKKLQLVARYTFLDSAGANGITPQRRYENEVPGVQGTHGDRYQAFYAGVNYYLYGHKLKFQTGIEYSHLGDSARDGGAFDAWSYSAGFRLSF